MRKLLVLMSILVFLGCSTSNQGVSPTNVPASKALRFGVLAADRALYQSLESQFERDYPDIDIQIVTLDTLLHAARNTDDAGLSSFRSISEQMDVANLPVVPYPVLQNKIFADLQPFINTDPSFLADDFFPNVLESGQVDGALYVIPQTVSVSLLSYNKQLWQSYELPAPQANWYWKDLIAAAEQLTVRDGEQILRYGLLDWGGSTLLQFALADAGIDLEDPDLRLDHSTIREVLRQYKQLIDRGIIYNPHIANAQHSLDQVHNLILQEQAAIWPRSMFELNTLSELPTFEIGTLAYPQTNLALTQSAQGLVMSNHSAHPLEAWRWISFVSQRATQHTVSPSTLAARRSLAAQSQVWQQFDPEAVAAVQAWVEQPKPSSKMNNNPVPNLLNTALLSLWQGNTIDQAMVEAQQSFANQKLLPIDLMQAANVPATIPTSVPLQAREHTIRFAGIGLEQDNLQAIIQRFHKAQPGILVDSNLPLNIPIEQIQADCLTLPPTSIAKYQNTLLDLQPLLDRDRLEPHLFASLLAANQHDGHLYGLPYQVKVRQVSLLSNEITEHGLDPNMLARDHQQLLATAQQLHSREIHSTNIYGYAVAGSMLSNLMFNIERFGGRLSTGEGPELRAQFLDEQVVQALQWYLAILRYSPHTELTGYRYDSASEHDLSIQALIHTGQVAMWQNDSNNQSPSKQGQVQAIAPPLGRQSLRSNDLNIISLAIMANSKEYESCWQWFKFLSNDLASYNSPNILPARRTILDNPHYPYTINNLISRYGQALTQTIEPSIEYRNSPIDYYWFFRAVDRAIQGADLYKELQQAQDRTNAYLDCMILHANPSMCAIQVDLNYQGWHYNKP